MRELKKKIENVDNDPEELKNIQEKMKELLLERSKAIADIEGWNMENVEWVFSPGVLPRAIEDDAMLILDEWNKAPVGVRELTNGVIGKPNNPTYGASKFVSYANGGGEYIVGEHFFVAAAVNFPDPASARYPFHEAEMRRLDLQILSNLSSDEAISRNVEKRLKYHRDDRNQNGKLKEEFSLKLRSTLLPLDSDPRLAEMWDIIEVIIESAHKIMSEKGIRQSQEISLVGARDIIFDFIMDLQFEDFTAGIFFVLDHYFINKIIDPNIRKETKTLIVQIMIKFDTNRKIDEIINQYELSQTYSEDILQKIQEMSDILGLKNNNDVFKVIRNLTQEVREMYRQVSEDKKTIDVALEFLEDIKNLGNKDKKWFDDVVKSLKEVKKWRDNRKFEEILLNPSTMSPE